MIKVKPDYEELEKQDGKRHIVYAEIMADIKTPIQALRTLKSAGKKCFLLESVEGGEKWSRYSFLGVNPIAEITEDAGAVTLSFKGKKSVSRGDFAEKVRALLKEYACLPIKGLPPMTGGLAGYFSYDYGARLNGVSYEKTAVGCHGAHLMLFDCAVSYDHFRQKIFITALALADRADYERAAEKVRELALLLTKAEPEENEGFKLCGEFVQSPDRQKFTEIVEKIKSQIREGEIFQAVPSLTQSAPCEGSLLNCYRHLRTGNPSPYMFYMDTGDCEFCGASPETLIKKTGEKLTTFPIAGTIARGEDDITDAENERKLMSDEKELAEHNMLVDLGRNDLSKAARIGSVQVNDYMKVMRFSKVMHITTEVSAKIENGLDALDALHAVLPAGTLSGAPKRRAMQIIADAEDGGRGVYGGAVGYIGLTGDADFCIGIRLAAKSGGEVRVRSGCGVVADSAAENEYLECINKAAAVTDALKLSAEEI